MPYIAIQGFPKDDEIVKKVAERFNETLLELWVCRQEDISISYEAIAPEEWDERIVRGVVEQKREKMLILNGKRRGADGGLTIFHMNGCPYCRKARQALEELLAEQPEYRQVPVTWIEENEHSDIAERYDYYSVPSIFLGEKKLYEARPTDSYELIKSSVRSALDAAR